ncbi:MAG TPA: glycosyltransferase family 39 protein [bacterium]|nr:glycosyltransferase family 39 protein [bacterium]HQL62563.1 glycosyltransferase family 39 protein [bacterium]
MASIILCMIGMATHHLVLNYVCRSFQHDYDIWFYTGRVAPFSFNFPIIRLSSALAGLFLSLAFFPSRVRFGFLGALVCAAIPSKYSPGVFFTVFTCWWAYCVYSEREIPPTVSRWAFVAALVLGTGLRVDAWAHTAYAPLGQDVGPMVGMARDTHRFYDSGLREPLWVNIAKLSTTLLHTEDSWAVSLPFLLISLAWMPAVYFIGGSIFNRRLSLCSVWLVAVNRSLVYYATRGMRVELYGLLLFLVIGFVCSRVELDGKRTVALALSIAAMCLTRLNGLILGIYFLAVLIITRRLHWLRVLFVFAVIMGAMSPYLIYAKRKYGHADYMLRMNATWTLNMEFAGQPGFPTKEEIATDACVGKKITFTQYLFEYHTVAQVIKFYLIGLAKATLGQHASYVHYTPGGPWWILCFIVGCLACLFRPQRAWLVLHYIVSLHAVPIMIGSVNLDWRHVLSIYPLISLLTAFGFASILDPTVMSPDEGHDVQVPAGCQTIGDSSNDVA